MLSDVQFDRRCALELDAAEVALIDAFYTAWINGVMRNEPLRPSLSLRLLSQALLGG